jgi:diguanylate cyclase (GGDEF)-like protein
VSGIDSADTALGGLSDAAEIAASRERLRERLLGRERTVTLLLAGAFVVAATACAAWLPSSVEFDPNLALFCVVVYAIVARIEFEVGPGAAVPTELVFVPMLFVLPPGTVPFAVAAGLLLAGGVDRLRGRMRSERAVVRLCSAWYSVGPALVVALLAPGAPSWRNVPVYVLALLSQFGFDAGAVVLRHRFGRGVAIPRLIRPLAFVMVADLALAPAGLVTAFAAANEPIAVVCVLPLAGLLYFLQGDRRSRIDETLLLGRAVEDAAQAARRDPLTCVGNRLAWEEATGRAAATVADGGAATVLLVDLDGLKRTNDSYGHDAGDRVLQVLAAALYGAAGEDDHVARLGGDEFGILSLGTGTQSAVVLHERVRAALHGLRGPSGIPVVAAVGMASCPPCSSVGAAIRLADDRLRADKRGA